MLAFREQIREFGILGTMEGFDSGLFALFSLEHKPSGKHGAMTVESVTEAGHPAALLTRVGLQASGRIQNDSDPANLFTATSPFTIADGEMVQMIVQWQNFNNDSSSNSFTLDLRWGGSQIELLDLSLFGITVRSVAVLIQAEIWLFRVGVDLYVTTIMSGAEGFIYRGDVINSARFTKGCPVALIMEMSTADNNFWQEGVAGVAYHYRL